MELTKKENEIKLMATWISQMGILVKKTGIPKNIEIDHEGEYILYGVDWDKEDPLENAEELYEEGYRLVSTKIEKLPDFWSTGYALKLVK